MGYTTPYSKTKAKVAVPLDTEFKDSKIDGTSPGNLSSETLLFSQGIIGFALGFGCLFLLEALFCNALKLSPRGLGWITLPFGTGTLGYKYFKTLHLGKIAKRLQRVRSVRYFLAGGILWILIVTTYAIFDTSINSFYGFDWSEYSKLTLIPLVIGGVGAVLFSWARKKIE